jgi:hypothetical protein
MRARTLEHSRSAKRACRTLAAYAFPRVNRSGLDGTVSAVRGAGSAGDLHGRRRAHEFHAAGRWSFPGPVIWRRSGFGVSGLLLVGPFELLVAAACPVQPNGYVWAFAAVLYCLVSHARPCCSRRRGSSFTTSRSINCARPWPTRSTNSIPHARWAGGSVVAAEAPRRVLSSKSIRLRCAT